MKKSDPMVQPVTKRLKNFEEVSLGFNKAQAISECQRCPQCSDAPCAQACPLGVDVLSFIRMIREGDFAKALGKIRENNCLVGVCGRICSAPCETACILNREKNPLPIAIRMLERSAFDHGHSRAQEISQLKRPNATGKKVAIIGSGVAGLISAAELVREGHSVVVFEALHKAGGFLQYGVPSFRLPKKVLDSELAHIASLGVEIKVNMLMGQVETINEILGQGFDTVLLATGLSFGQRFELLGCEARGVLSSQEFLFRAHFMKAYEHSKDRAISGVGQHLAIVGSGFDALDCARLALRLGKKVTLIHSSTDDDLEASRQDKTFAREEGLVIESLSRPLGILSDQSGVVCGLRCVRVDFADHGGEWKLLAVKDSEFTLEVDTVIFSGQYKANNFLAAITEGLKVSKQGLLSVKKDQGKTSFANVYATGSLVKGPMDFISTLADAKKTAKEIGLGFEGKGKKRA